MLRTAYYHFHNEHGAKFVNFAGWEMPILYRSIHEEHRHVRTCGGLFDISHMGRIEVRGVHARRLLERVLTRRISDMTEMHCRYSLICNAQGGTLDDVVVYRFEDHWLVVCNALNRHKVHEHMQALAGSWQVKIEDQTESTAMIAVQGPKVMQLIGSFSTEVPALKRYGFCIKNLLVLKMTISRTGYTGEDGVEVIMGAAMAPMAIKLLFRRQDNDTENALMPAGLGARDTLRMEAGMPLYGHELNETFDPLSAGLGFAVSLDKDTYKNGEPFIGQRALKRIAADGPKRPLCGLRLEGKRTPRQHMPVCRGDQTVGYVTSGCVSPTLGYPIAMAYVQDDAAEVGTGLNIEIGNKRFEAQVVALPFFTRA